MALVTADGGTGYWNPHPGDNPQAMLTDELIPLCRRRGLGTAGLGPSLLVLMGEIVPRDRQGTGAGLLQFCGDLGGMLGPLIGTALFAGDVAIPYLGTAALVAAFVPAAAWLARIERRAAPAL